MTTTKDNTVIQALGVMSKNRVSCLIVVEDDKLSGIITHRDVIERVVVKGLDPQKTLVSAAMTSPVHTVMPDQEVLYAAVTMNSLFIKQLPVIDDEGAMVGIVTQTDIVRNILHLAF